MNTLTICLYSPSELIECLAPYRVVQLVLDSLIRCCCGSRLTPAINPTYSSAWYIPSYRGTRPCRSGGRAGGQEKSNPPGVFEWFIEVCSWSTLVGGNRLRGTGGRHASMSACKAATCCSDGQHSLHPHDPPLRPSWLCRRNSTTPRAVCFYRCWLPGLYPESHERMPVAVRRRPARLSAQKICVRLCAYPIQNKIQDQILLVLGKGRSVERQLQVLGLAPQNLPYTA